MKRFHSYLKKYKDIHSDKVAVIFGTGPTLNDFSFDLIPEKKDDLILYGCNTMCYREDIPLDYYFCGDMTAGSLKPIMTKDGKRIIHRRNTPTNVVKQYFGVDYMDKIKWYVSNVLKREAFCITHIIDYVKEINGILRYREQPNGDGWKENVEPIRSFLEEKPNVRSGWSRGHWENLQFRHEEAEDMGCNCIASTKRLGYEMKPDISKHLFWPGGKIFSVFQFALYNGVKKIYIVGCDVGGKAKYFMEDLEQTETENKVTAHNWSKIMVNDNFNQWRRFKHIYIKKYFPDVEIVNINPKRLAGMWDKDIYTKNIKPQINTNNKNNEKKIEWAKNYKDHYDYCRSLWNKKNDSKYKSVYDLVVDKTLLDDVIDDRYYELIDIIRDKLHKRKSFKCVTKSAIRWHIKDWNELPEMRELASIVIPPIEENIFHCNANIEHIHPYKNIENKGNQRGSWKWHWDNCPYEYIKLIIYLTDVTENNGCMQYIESKVDSIRTSPFLAKKSFDKTGIKSTTGGWSIKEKEKIDLDIYKSRIDSSIIDNNKVINDIGKKGSYTIFTPNIPHRATNPEEGVDGREAIVFFIRPQAKVWNNLDSTIGYHYKLLPHMYKTGEYIPPQIYLGVKVYRLD